MPTLTAVDNATTLAAMYEAFFRGDIPFIINGLADNCTWIGAGEGALPQGGTYLGKDAQTFFARMGETTEFNEFNPVSISNINDHEVVSFGNFTITVKATGKQFSSEWVMHLKFNDEGKVVYFHDFFDTAAAYIANQQ